jgi:hypothetical protein
MTCPLDIAVIFWEKMKDKRKDVYTKVDVNMSKMQTMWVRSKEKSIVRFYDRSSFEGEIGSVPLRGTRRVLRVEVR